MKLFIKQNNRNYLDATGGFSTVARGRRSLLFDGLFNTCKIVIWLLFTICSVNRFLAEHWYLPVSDACTSIICKFPLGKILYRSIKKKILFIFFDENYIRILGFDSIPKRLLFKVKIGIGFGFPLGSSHGITAMFPSVKLRKLFSLLGILNGSKAKWNRWIIHSPHVIVWDNSIDSFCLSIG